MKILNLVIFNEGVNYNRMRLVLSSLYQRIPFVDTWFLSCSGSTGTLFVHDKTSLILDGNESVVPGLLRKTINASLRLRHVIEESDYVVRSNVSTVVNFLKIPFGAFKEASIDYFGASQLQLEWLDPPSGIADTTMFGTRFITGSCMCFSSSIYLRMLDDRESLDYSVIDDVSIGSYISSKFRQISPHQFPENRVAGYRNPVSSISEIQKLQRGDFLYAARFKSDNRDLDTELMAQYVSESF